MDPKKKAITAAIVGTALGVGGLVVIAMPASAGAAPQLPAVSAQDLVQSVLTTKTPAFDGTVKLDQNLGLPSLAMVPGAGALSFDSARVFNDGAGNSKLSVQQGATESTVIHNGSTVWTYNSKDNSATKVTIPADQLGKATDNSQMADPATATAALLSKVQETSTVSVDGTAKVAERSAYELVLTPKPAERTVLREIRIAVDSETRLPLRLSVLTNGSADPAVQLSFTGIQFTQQPASLFQFTPPKGAKVTDKQPTVDSKTAAEAQQAGKDVTVTGNGWDTVVSGKIPADTSTAKKPGGKSVDPQALISRFGKPVSGTWGSGHLFTTKIGSAVITDDGRFAAGAVPEQVLYEALGAK